SMAATLATIRELEKGDICQKLFNLGEKFRNLLDEVIANLKLRAQIVGFGSVFQLLFTDKEIYDYRDVLTSNTEWFKKFQKEMMNRGIFFIPQANKRWHLSAAHTIEDLRYTIECAREVLENMK
ncbi:MAG: aspartate aminotransferase family protein, partial [Candidatus Bathyarchaeota archaeon]